MGAHAPRARSRAWVLNLDADLELGAGASYTPSKRVLTAMAVKTAPLRALLDPGDVVVDATTPAGALSGALGVAFCPTPRALAWLRHVGAEPAPHPSVEVLRVVASRAFGLALGSALRGAIFTSDAAVVARVVASTPAVGRGWRLKRAYGMAGRGHRVVAAGTLSSADAAFVAASGPAGLVVEPEVEIVEELGLHGVLTPEGALRHGALVRQTCDAHGAWVSTERVTDHAAASRIFEELERVGRALHRADYFGPFGIDAFTYRDGARVALQPRSEINPRYSMGFAVGFLGR
ncbi:MAG: hypothetical protein IPJ34_03330 [Myxococcales bacterium]|nr:hypothetical protein [Myxococcales bacterium]